MFHPLSDKNLFSNELIHCSTNVKHKTSDVLSDKSFIFIVYSAKWAKMLSNPLLDKLKKYIL